MTNDERILSVEEARAIDRDASERLGMPSILLMENAARGVAEVAARLGSHFVILCGAGNNGGDGLAVARHLGHRRCSVHLLAEPDPAKAPDAALQATILRNAGATLHLHTGSQGGWPDIDEQQDAVWIDALFGTGLDRELRGAARSWVEAFNQASGTKLSVDIPSGLHGDTGQVLGVACRADVTVTFVARKHGMVRGAGEALCGRVEVVGLGLP